MDFTDWLVKKEKVVLLTNSKKYELAMSTSIPYKMLKRMDGAKHGYKIRKMSKYIHHCH